MTRSVSPADLLQCFLRAETNELAFARGVRDTLALFGWEESSIEETVQGFFDALRNHRRSEIRARQEKTFARLVKLWERRVRDQGFPSATESEAKFLREAGMKMPGHEQYVYSTYTEDLSDLAQTARSCPDCGSEYTRVVHLTLTTGHFICDECGREFEPSTGQVTQGEGAMAA